MTNFASRDPVPSLRERLVEDMNLHRLSRATQRNYAPRLVDLVMQLT